MAKRKIKKENEGHEVSTKTEIANEGYDKIVTVTRTNLSFLNAERLKPDDLIKHSRIMKVISVKLGLDNKADVELEIIKKYWENY